MEVIVQDLMNLLLVFCTECDCGQALIGQQKAPTNMVGAFLRLYALSESATLSWLAFVATDGSPHQVFAFHAVDCSRSFFLVGHFNKSKTTRPSSFTIVDDPCTVHRSISLKGFAQGNVINAPSKVSNKNVHINKLEDSKTKVGEGVPCSTSHA